MEEFPGRTPEEKPADESEKKKKRKKRLQTRVPGLIPLDPEVTDKSTKPEKKEPKPAKQEEVETPIDEATSEKADDALADAVETTGESEVEHAAEVEHDATETTGAETIVEDPEQVGQTDSEIYEPLPTHELEPVEFSGGEVIIHLSGDTPVEERVEPVQPQLEISRTVPAEELLIAPEPTFAPVEADVPPSPQPREVLIPNIPPAAIEAVQLAPLANEKIATKQELEDAIYYATKAGQHRGVIAGGLVAGGYEHFKHRRRERVQAKRFEAQSQQLDTARQDLSFARQETVAAREQFAEQAARNEERLASLEQTHVAQPNQVRADVSGESRPQTPSLSEAEPQLIVPPEHRIETSAWHSIEVDAKTGRPVEAPSFQYGHEYYRERAQENTPLEQRNVATGGVALTAATQSTSEDGSLSSSSSIPDATHQGPPPSLPSASQKSGISGATKQSADTAQPLWPWLLGLVFIAIILIFIAR